MSWDREGQYVTANHMGLLISGTVTHSRVKYGGEGAVYSCSGHYPWLHT